MRASDNGDNFRQRNAEPWQANGLAPAVGGIVTLTEEQHGAVLATRAGLNLAVNAFAGAGKTSTAKAIAEDAQSRGQRVLYLVFNRAMADEARRRLGCEARTFHSLAVAAVRPNMARLAARPTGAYVAEALRLAPLRVGPAPLGRADLGSAVLQTLARFAASADPAVAVNHVPKVSRIIDLPDWQADRATEIDGHADALAVRRAIADAAARLFARMCDPLDTVPVTFDAVAKQWTLAKPRIDADLILFDEAQDASPCFIAAIEAQAAQRVWIGDAYQQIYDWRGARNALATVAADRHLWLSESFRFGPAIAAIASRILARLGAPKPVIGRGGAPKGGPSAILCRTNERVLSAYLERCGEGGAVRLEGAADLAPLIRAIDALRDGRPIGPLRLLRSYAELLDYIAKPEGGDLKAVVDAVEKVGADRLLADIDAAKRRDRAEVVVSTVHKAKGREWDRVAVAPWGRKLASDAEWRLAYVAATRARCAVTLPPEIESAAGGGEGGA